MAQVLRVAAAFLVTHCESIRSVEVAFEARLASFANSASASSAAADLAAHLRSLGEDEPHHVCVTGNAAKAAVDTFVLQGSGTSRTDFSMPSKISSNACTVQEAQVGSTLFTIAESLPDSCLPRWRAQSSSCDVLFHAHSGGDCTDLSKFRLVNDKCDADLLVVSDTKELSQCFDSKMAAHDAAHPGSACEHRGLWLNANEGNVGHDFGAAMKTAMSKHSGEIKAKFFQARGSSVNTKAPLRDQLLGMTNAQQSINVHDDLLKASQGLSGAQAGSLAQHVSSMSSKGKAIDEQIVIIDAGSGSVKAGLPAETPSIVFPAITAQAKYDKALVGIDHKDMLIGDEAQQKRGVHKLTHPVVHGIVQDWNGMEAIWTHTFTTELNLDPSQCAVMLTEAPANPKKNRDQMATIMFETFRVPKMYVAMQAVLALYSTGKTTGLSIDSGDGVTHIVPVYDGYALPHAIKRIDLGGADLTNYMMKLLMERGEFRPTTSAEREITRDIKEKLGYVAQNFEEELGKGAEEADYTLPDGAAIKVGSEAFRCAEPMFQPKMVGLEQGGLHTAAFQVIQNCDIDIRSDLYENIVISGGNTMFKGFADRLEAEIKGVAPEHANVKVIAKEDRRYAVWTGAAILTSLANFDGMWVSKTEYDEDTNVIHTKCAY